RPGDERRPFERGHGRVARDRAAGELGEFHRVDALRCAPERRHRLEALALLLELGLDGPRAPFDERLELTLDALVFEVTDESGPRHRQANARDGDRHRGGRPPGAIRRPPALAQHPSSAPPGGTPDDASKAMWGPLR